MSANTLLTSIVTGGTNNHATTSEEANALATDFATPGVVGTIGLNVGSGGTGSFCVNADASPDMGVTIKAGQAYISATPSGQNSQVLRVRAASDYTAYTINANSSGATKYDWIYLTIDPTNANNPASDASNVASFVTSRSSSNTADNGTPPTYGIVLAVVTVANGASSITNGNIQDKRTQASITIPTAATNGWNSLTNVPSSITYNGNRSYSVVFSSVDLTGTLSPGMRLRTTRTTPAPAQSTSLNGTTQYYSKSSPAGMTFTNNFVVSGRIKPSSYAASTIASRYNGTSGWVVNMLSTGQIQAQGINGGSGNTFTLLSYQSVPLNKWTHVAVKVDMTSTITTGGTNNYILIDGIEVPASASRAGTNPTALVQAGNLEIGSQNGGTAPFPGKLAQVAIYGAHVAESAIVATISQGLAGTETNLISAYSFNNSINDLNANANNLTANGGAVATNADSPFTQQAGGTPNGTLDYGIVQSVSFSTNTTVVVQVPEGCTIPTSGGVSAVSYSGVKAPYGMPVQRGKWNIEWLAIASINLIGSNNAWGTGVSGATTGFTIPIGEWRVTYDFAHYADRGTSVSYEMYASLSTDANNPISPRWTSNVKVGIGSGLTYAGVQHTKTGNLSVTAQTVYYGLFKGNSSDGTLGNHGLNELAGPSSMIIADNAYL